MFYIRIKGQSTLEYVMLLGFVVAALIAMGAYMKRGAEGKLRESTDQIGEQYDANNTTSVFTTNSFSSQNETMLSGGATTTLVNSTQSRGGNETVAAW